MKGRWQKLRKRGRQIFQLGLVAAVGLVLINGWFIFDTADQVYADPSKVPHRSVGLVLGCSRTLANGRSNLYFRYRMDAAAKLYHAGKVDVLLVSGDNSSRYYDEPTDMKQALVDRGVPVDRIFCDYAGFRTFDSVIRAKQVFRADGFTVISQEFHNQRALFIGNRRGMQSVGFNAREVTGHHGIRTRLREYLARTVTVLDLYVLQTKPKFLGEPESLEVYIDNEEQES